MVIKQPFNGRYYGENVEAELEDYMTKLRDYCRANYGRDTPYPLRTKKPERIQYPDADYTLPKEAIKKGNKTSDTVYDLPVEKQKKIQAWWEVQAERCRSGHDDLVGSYYEYFNFVKGATSRGRVEPMKYRTMDAMEFALFEACFYGDNEYYQGYKGKGVIGVGCRQNGKTTRAASWGCKMQKESQSAVTVLSSKEKDDAIKKIYKAKVKPIWKSIPDMLKPHYSKISLLTKSFDIETEYGSNYIEFGGGDAEDTEGITATFVFVDEGPKTRHFEEKLRNMLPLVDSPTESGREGFFLITGVAGDQEKFGHDFKVRWDQAPQHDFIRWFIAYWAKGYIDEFGNYDIERTVREELEYRHRFWSDNIADPRRAVQGRMQQRPLTPEESFLDMSSGLWGEAGEVISNQKKRLEQDPIRLQRGYFRWVEGQEYKRSRWIPDPNGDVKILLVTDPEDPQTILGWPNPDFTYCGGCDAYGRKQNIAAKGEGSEGAFYICSLPNPNLMPAERMRFEQIALEGKTSKDRAAAAIKLGGIPLLEYIAAPQSPRKFAQQTLMALCYYSSDPSRRLERAQALYETQPDVIHDEVLEKAPEYSAPTPIPKDKKITSAMLSKKGIKIDKPMKERRVDTCGDYFLINGHMIYFNVLLGDVGAYDDDDEKGKKDSVDGLFLTILNMEDPRTQKKNMTRALKQARSSGKNAPLPLQFRRRGYGKA